MLPFHGRCPVGQYVKCGKSWMAYNFVLYQEAGTGTSPQHCFLRASILMRLVENIQRHKNFEILFNNFFTSVALLLELKALVIHALGVMKSNPMAGAASKSKKAMGKEGRGSLDSRVFNSGEVVVVHWHDNNSTNVASTFAGT